jgi:hypothetical protein
VEISRLYRILSAICFNTQSSVKFRDDSLHEIKILYVIESAADTARR